MGTNWREMRSVLMSWQARQVLFAPAPASAVMHTIWVSGSMSTSIVPPQARPTDHACSSVMPSTVSIRLATIGAHFCNKSRSVLDSEYW